MIVSITNLKGGVGKTITSLNLAAGLQKRGFRVLLCDLDSQMNLTTDLDASAGRTMMDILTGEAAAEEAIVRTECGDLIPADEQLAAADMIITESGKEYRLKKALDSVKGRYDYIVCDCPPNLGILTTNALTASDTAVICSQADVNSLKGIARLYGSIQSVRRYCNPGLSIAGILITRFNKRSVLGRDMKENLQDAADQMNTKLFSTPIRECTAIREAETRNQDIFSFNKKSNGAIDYDSFINEFLKEGR